MGLEEFGGQKVVGGNLLEICGGGGSERSRV